MIASDFEDLKKRGDAKVLIDILNTGDVEEKREAAFVLGELKSKLAVGPLIGLLQNDDAIVRTNAAWSLGEIGDAAAVLPLIDLLYDPNRNVQIHAAWSLGRIGDKHAISYMHVAMKNDSSPDGNQSEDIGVPLVTLDVLPEFEFNSPNIEYDPKKIRKVVLGLKNGFHGSVSIDVLFKYTENTDSERVTNSIWLQMANKENRRIKKSRKNKTATKEQKEYLPKQEPVIEEVKSQQPNAPAPQLSPSPSSLKPVEPIPDTKSQEKTPDNVDSAVKLLSDIGLSGIEHAASAVGQLSGQEGAPGQMRTLPIEQMRDEIVNLGDSIVLIEVNLHGKGSDGEMSGKMQLYLSKDAGIEISNELLCNPPDALCKEFNEDVISTLKETANIFGGQYVSAVSEYIGVPILLEAPHFENGPSSQIADSVMKDIKGKVEFVLATDLALGKNRTGRLVMLLDPKSFEVIVSKLF